MTDDNSLNVFRLVNEFCNQSTIINNQKEKLNEIMNLLAQAVEIIDDTYSSDVSHDFLFKVLPNSNIPYCLNCTSIKNHQPIFMCKCELLICDDCVKKYKGLCLDCLLNDNE
jgi:hypothetical protein